VRALRLATRGSPLARYQAELVRRLLLDAGAPEVELVVVRTTGDRVTDVPVERIGGQGAFVKEVQTAVAGGAADLAVHSAKDLPSRTPDGLVLACVPERVDPRDALVGRRLDELPPGGTVASGSVRRRAQLAWLRPDLTFVELRGNMATRIERARATGAGVVAAAALLRLGLEHEMSQILETDVMCPQVAQGAIAVECRTDDAELREALDALDDSAAHRAVRAERAFLATLGGGCTLPLGAYATTGHGGELVVTGMLASRDGHVVLRDTVRGGDPEELGRTLALRLLHDHGGRDLEDWPLPDRAEA